MIAIVQASPEHLDGWAALRHLLWDEETVEGHREEAEEQLADAERFLNLVALDGDAVVGFAEASIRQEYVNGCEDSPVLFLEGICVAPEARRQGLAKRLVAAVAEWGRAQGIREFASDTWHDDTESHAFHLAAGFVETERVVYFRQEL